VTNVMDDDVVGCAAELTPLREQPGAQFRLGIPHWLGPVIEYGFQASRERDPTPLSNQWWFLVARDGRLEPLSWPLWCLKHGAIAPVNGGDADAVFRCQRLG